MFFEIKTKSSSIGELVQNIFKMIMITRLEELKVICKFSFSLRGIARCVLLYVCMFIDHNIKYMKSYNEHKTYK